MDTGLAVRLAIVVAAALLLTYVFLAYVRRDRKKTQHMLDPFLNAIDHPQVGRSPWGYEFLEGSFGGRPVRVSLIPDSLITRTLPTLWLEVRWARPSDAFLCVITLCNGMEYFADEVDEGGLLVTPSTWPESVRVRGKGPASSALARRLNGFAIDAYKDLKMVSLSETETKVIMRCARGDLQLYRVLRSASFPEDSVKPELVEETVRVLRDIDRMLESEEEVA
jgi:hypothetical protein